MTQIYRLKISRVAQTALFELTWGKGLYLPAELPYPSQLDACYRAWQGSYLQHYQRALRGRAVVSGKMTPQQDWHSQLVKAEAALLSEFHKWLRQEPLFEIRKELGRPAARANTEPKGDKRPQTDLLIACESGNLGRLPWETWEIGAEFGTTQPIRIGRLPVRVREEAVPAQPQRGKARILVVLGDDTGLSFAAEQDEIAALNRLAEIHTIGWKPGTDINQLKQTICDRLQDPSGWDMLLFFGHSNEAKQVGGEIAIAPNTSLSLRELDPYLRQAKAHGLKFALFNSCKGLDIAQTLIDLGLNQVVVMREPIHDRVAHVFLKQFMRSLAQFDDVHTALRKASQFLYSSNQTYPSAHLVPSLFRHSDAIPFQLQPVGWQAWLWAGLPSTRWQTAALGLVAALSLVPPVGSSLTAGRLWTQALYRDVTQQIPAAAPPVVLVQIDDESIRRGIPSGVPNPIDRAYLAEIVDRLSALDAQVIGIDYLLDRPQEENDARLAQSLAAAAEQGSWLVFGTILEADAEVEVRDDLASLDWAMQGYTNTPQWYLRALPASRSCQARCPFTYLLALTQAATQSSLVETASPVLASPDDLRERLLNSIETQNPDEALRQLYRLRLPWLSSLALGWKQRWLHPILDFSLPPDQVYNRLSAYQLLDSPLTQLQAQFDWSNQVVIVASGGYAEAGTGFSEDYFPLPPALAHWHQRQSNASPRLTGGEVNAYGVHHFLQPHRVVPIPNLWLVGVGAIAGAGLFLFLRRRSLSRPQQWLLLTGLSAGYGLISLQFYVSALVLLPWLLPTAVVWIYCLPQLTRSR